MLPCSIQFIDVKRPYALLCVCIFQDCDLKSTQAHTCIHLHAHTHHIYLRTRPRLILFAENLFKNLRCHSHKNLSLTRLNKQMREAQGETGRRGRGGKLRVSLCTHIDNIILGIVCVGAANVEPVALLHRLYDAHMILAIKHLKRDRA